MVKCITDTSWGRSRSWRSGLCTDLPALAAQTPRTLALLIPIALKMVICLGDNTLVVDLRFGSRFVRRAQFDGQCAGTDLIPDIFIYLSFFCVNIYLEWIVKSSCGIFIQPRILKSRLDMSEGVTA